jgi:hypothetical protein
LTKIGLLQQRFGRRRTIQFGWFAPRLDLVFRA